MHNRFKKLFALLTALLLLLSALPALAKSKTINLNAADYPVEKNGWYSTMEEVAVYLATYEKLPGNFLTKNKASDKGWDNRAGNLDEVAPGCSIGGDRFGNYEGQLPDKMGRKWTECDINYTGGYRGGERIVFSSDGLIYYTGDHYNSFTQIKVSFEKAAEKPKEIKLDLKVELDEYGEYTTLNEVAAYLVRFGNLPCNYLTKADAEELGWTAKKDNLGDVMPGCSIGGDEFQNREKLLPTKKGRTWYECDLNSVDGKRSDERLVYSSDGLLFYTPDAHKSFIELH